ncbi:MAG: hypothetical protein QOD94_228 [Alphaproteobacteria bacterium]|nr:hypothetical protein [Alphaproteobacteria bacterium]
MNEELQALRDADFGWVRSLDSVWSDEENADAGPNQDQVNALINELAGLQKSPNPPGRVLLGQAGIGKTHLVGVLRREAWKQRCWFVMLDVVGITDFWQSAALSFVTSLLQVMPGGQRQHEAVLAGIARRFNIEKEVDLVLASPTVQPKRVVDLLVGGLIKIDAANTLKYQDVFRALALLRSHDLTAVGIAHAWLQGYDADEATRKNLGFLKPPPAPVEIVRGLLWVMGLAAPTLIAVDQIDGVLSSSAGSEFSGAPDFTQVLTGGLLGFTSTMNRSMIVLTCLLSSWEIIRKLGPTPLTGRFTAPFTLRPAQTHTFVSNMIAERLAPAYAKAGIPPKSPTWPFTDAAIHSALGITPRTILMRCNQHRKRCIGERTVSPCNSLIDKDASELSPQLTPPNGFREQFLALTGAASLDGMFNDKDDGKLGTLLRDAFDLYAKQIAPHDDYDVESRSDPVQKTPPLHGRLAFTDHRANDRERHYCFRALLHSNAVALGARFKAALTASGVSAKISDRKLIIVRRGPPPSGPKTKELFATFRSSGGIEIDPSDDDLRTFVALRLMLDAALAEGTFDAFENWLIAEKPLCNIEFFKSAGLSPPPLPPWDGDASRGGVTYVKPNPQQLSNGSSGNDHATAETQSPVVREGSAAGSSRRSPAERPMRVPEASPSTAIPIGRRMNGEETQLPTSLLPRHTAIIAGAGSGKTVLLRRIVEEAALAGIPSIVIDPNNDLSRLGDAWPERPVDFTDADEAKAQRYAATVNVVVWTPGVHAGNPLSSRCFQSSQPLATLLISELKP